MITVKDQNQLKDLEEGNIIFGEPELDNSSIVFNGSNNVLFCEEGKVKLSNSKLIFNGSNGLIFLGANRHIYRLAVTVNNDCVFHMGRNNYMNGVLNVILSEQRHCFIGDDGLFSFGVWLRTADPHLIYDAQTKKRINPSKSIFIGDHVWIGQGAMILKRSVIESGSIVGAMSLVAGKRIPNNSSWAGNPCREVRKGIFWEESCVHTWQADKTKKSLDFNEYLPEIGKKVNADTYVYGYSTGEYIPFAEIDRNLSENTDAVKKAEYLKNLSSSKKKNRFVYGEDDLKNKIKRLLKK